jgi:hypothetical protein
MEFGAFRPRATAIAPDPVVGRVRTGGAMSLALHAILVAALGSRAPGDRRAGRGPAAGRASVPTMLRGPHDHRRARQGWVGTDVDPTYACLHGRRPVVLAGLPVPPLDTSMPPRAASKPWTASVMVIVDAGMPVTSRSSSAARSGLSEKRSASSTKRIHGRVARGPSASRNASTRRRVASAATKSVSPSMWMLVVCATRAGHRPRRGTLARSRAAARSGAAHPRFGRRPANQSSRPAVSLRDRGEAPRRDTSCPIRSCRARA